MITLVTVNLLVSLLIFFYTSSYMMTKAILFNQMLKKYAKRSERAEKKTRIDVSEVEF